MILSSVRSVSATALKRPTVVIASCGYETRARHILRFVRQEPAFGIALAFEEQRELFARNLNEVSFQNAGFDLFKLSANSYEDACGLASRAIQRAVADDTSLLVDISSMSRVWQAAIVRSLLVANGTRLQVDFMYQPAAFTGYASQAAPAAKLGPLPTFAGLGLPTLPASLVLGLGYERERALGLAAILDPKLSALFVPNRKLKKYYKLVERNNEDLLTSTTPDLIFSYDVAHPGETFLQLESLAAGLREDSRVVMVSLGPKIFGLLCLLVASRMPDVSVWRMSTDGSNAKDVLPAPAEVTICRTLWTATPKINTTSESNLD